MLPHAMSKPTPLMEISSESPMADRRLPDVLREHDGTIRVLHALRPFAVAMAGPGEFDPYKD
jgi:tRNA-splicing ligase RtcB